MKFSTWPILRFVFGIALVPSTVSMAATPCPPPQVSAQGGTSASTTCPAASGGSGTYTTGFPATENPLSEGGKWVNGKANGNGWNNTRSTPGKAFASVLSGATGNRYDDSISHLSTSFMAFGANQYAQGTVFRASGYMPPQKHEVELHLRMSISANSAKGYEIMWGMDGGTGLAYIAMARWNGPLGDYTTLYDPGEGTIRMPQDGDVFYAQIVGNIITVKLNGAVVTTVDVNKIGSPIFSSGQPGMGFWPVDGATPANYGWKSYTAGGL